MHVLGRGAPLLSPVLRNVSLLVCTVYTVAQSDERAALCGLPFT